MKSYSVTVSFTEKIFAVTSTLVSGTGVQSPASSQFTPLLVTVAPRILSSANEIGSGIVVADSFKSFLFGGGGTNFTAVSSAITVDGEDLYLYCIPYCSPPALP